MDLTSLRSRLQLDYNDPIPQDYTSEVDLANRIIMDMTMGYGHEKEPVTPVSARHRVYYYNDKTGIWDELDKETFTSIAQMYSDVPIKTWDKVTRSWYNKRLKLNSNTCSGIFICAVRNPCIRDLEFFNEPIPGVAFKNTFVKVSEDGITIEGHKAEHRALTAMPYDFDEEAECPHWRELLNRVFERDEDREDKTKAFQEFIGACVTGLATQYQRCAILLGEGNNGKSTVAEALSDILFPAGSVTSVPPQMWSQPYYLSMLRDAKMNIASELPESKIMASATFKAVITGNSVTARDPYSKPYSFLPICGHLFSANELPGTIDNTEGFWRRFLVLTFNRDFTGDPDRTTKGCIKEVLAKEAPGIMLWALYGAVRLIKQKGEYTVPSSHKNMLINWRIESNSVAEFLSDCCERVEGKADDGQEHPDFWAPAGDLYHEFGFWAQQAGRKIVSKNTFGKRLVQLRVPRKRTKYGSIYQLALLPRSEWRDCVGAVQ